MKAGYKRSDRGWSWLERIEAIREKGGLTTRLRSRGPEVKNSRGHVPPAGKSWRPCAYLFDKGPASAYTAWPLPGRSGCRRLRRSPANHRTIHGQAPRSQRSRLCRSHFKPLVDSAFRRPATEEQLGNTLIHGQASGGRPPPRRRSASRLAGFAVFAEFSIVANGRGNLMIMIWRQDYPSF